MGIYRDLTMEGHDGVDRWPGIIRLFESGMSVISANYLSATNANFFF